MSYEIITPNSKDLYLRVQVDTVDTIGSRKIAHQIRELAEKLVALNVEEKQDGIR